MSRARTALICGLLALVPGTLALFISLGLGLIILELLTFALALTAFVVSNPVVKDKEALGHRLGVAGQSIALVAWLEIVAALVMKTILAG